MNMGPWELVTLLSLALSPLLLVAGFIWIGYFSSKAKQGDNRIAERETANS